MLLVTDNLNTFFVLPVIVVLVNAYTCSITVKYVSS